MDPYKTSVPPLKNPRYPHISRSAAKRESIQMLGSIQHLRTQFSGVSVSHRPGAGAGVKSASLESLGEEEEENGSPTEDGKKRRERKPWKDVDLSRVEPEAARKEAKEIVTRIREIWGLSMPSCPHSPTSLPSSKSLYFPNLENEEELRNSQDIRSALVTTARSIRRIRFLAFSVSQQQSSLLASWLLLPTSRLKPNFSTPSRPSVVLPRAVSCPIERKISDKKEQDVLYDLRKSALEVLTNLRGLEERLRVDKLDVNEDLDEYVSLASSTAGETTITGSALSSEPDYDTEYDSDSYNLNALAQEGDDSIRVSHAWEERISLEEREYRALEEQGWEKEARGTREGVGKWVGAVERLFVVGGKSEDDEKLATWVVDEEWGGNFLGRLHEFLFAHLSLDLVLHLPSLQSQNFPSNLLCALSDGYILIQAYNSALLSSSKPWGFITAEDIHHTLPSTFAGGSDTPTSEDSKKDKEWTFRKVGNLTCFAAALRHRYQLPISMPSNTNASSFLPKAVVLPQSDRTNHSDRFDRSGRSSSAPPENSPHCLASPSSTTPNVSGDVKAKGRDIARIDFDPMVVAKRTANWEEMLKEIICKWIESVAREKRGEGNQRSETSARERV
nr:hypothetical protein L203_01568 [Cryptococcus depauperatus CBS 7841]